MGPFLLIRIEPRATPHSAFVTFVQLPGNKQLPMSKSKQSDVWCDAQKVKTTSHKNHSFKTWTTFLLLRLADATTTCVMHMFLFFAVALPFSHSCLFENIPVSQFKTEHNLNAFVTRVLNHRDPTIRINEIIVRHNALRLKEDNLTS